MCTLRNADLFHGEINPGRHHLNDIDSCGARIECLNSFIQRNRIEKAASQLLDNPKKSVPTEKDMQIDRYIMTYLYPMALK